MLTGSCVEVTKTFPAESVDMAMFSPPYYGLRDYGKEGQLGLEPSWKIYVEHMVELCREVGRVLKKTGSMYVVIGDTYAGSHCGKGDRTLFQNEKRMKVAENLFQKPSPQANATDYKAKCLMGVPWRLAFALIDDGWILRNDVIWRKPNAMPSSVKDRLTQTYEHIFFLVKARRYYFDLDAIRQPHSDGTFKRIFQKTVLQQKGGNKQIILRGEKKSLRDRGSRCADMVKSLAEKYAYPEKLTKHDIAVRRFPTVNRRGGIGYTDPLHVKAYNIKGKNPGDFLSINTNPFRGAHFAVYPEAICVDPIKASCPLNGIVLDPMCGSGTTLVVAKKLGRRWIGIDLNPAYIEIAKERLNKIPEKLTCFS